MCRELELIKGSRRRDAGCGRSMKGRKELVMMICDEMAEEYLRIR